MSSSFRNLAPRLPGSAPAAEDRVGSKEHTEAEWLQMKDLIERLYIRDNRKLTETMAILESKHGFAATEQMYKKRLKKWKIRKRSYRKSSDSPAATTPPPRPSATALYAAGSDGDLAEEEEEEEEEEVMVVAAEEVPAGGWPSGAAPNRVCRLEPYAGLELVLDSVAAWSQSKLDGSSGVGGGFGGGGGGQPDPMSRYLASPNSPPMQDSRTMYRTFELVFDLWYYGKGQLAGMAARKAFLSLEFVLTEDQPDLVWHMLDATYDMVDRGHIQLLGMFLAHATVLARRLLPANHPLLRILQQLARCEYRTDEGRRQVCHALRTAWLRNVHLLGRHIGAAAPRRLWLYEQLIWDGRTRLRAGSGLATRHDDAITAALRALLERQGQGEDEGEDDSERLRVQALMLEYTQMDVGDGARAEALARDLLARTAGAGGAGDGARSHARFEAYAHKMLARLQQQRRDWDRAEENLRWAVTKREAAHGADSNLRVIRDMWVLAAHYQKAGRQDAAGRIAQDAVLRAERYLQADAGQ